MNFSKQMFKKDPASITAVIQCGCKIACEDTSLQMNEDEDLHELALDMLLSYACILPNPVAYSIF